MGHLRHLVLHAAHEDVRSSLLHIEFPAKLLVEPGEQLVSTIPSPDLLVLLEVLELEPSHPNIELFRFSHVLRDNGSCSLVVKNVLVLCIPKVA